MTEEEFELAVEAKELFDLLALPGVEATMRHHAFKEWGAMEEAAWNGNMDAQFMCAWIERLWDEQVAREYDEVEQVEAEEAF